MPYDITVRVFPVGDLAVNEQDAKNFMEWAWAARAINCIDPEVLGYPRAAVLCAEDKEPLLYMPVQAVLMLESLAPKPGLSPRKEALALWRMGEMLEAMSKVGGFREQYFLCKDDRVADICSKHGFEELKGYRILRKKVAPVEESK